MHEWFVPASTYLKDIGTVGGANQNVRVLVNVAFRFSPVDRDKLSPEADFQSTVLTIHDLDLRLTEEALKGDARKKYEIRKTKRESSTHGSDVIGPRKDD